MLSVLLWKKLNYSRRRKAFHVLSILCVCFLLSSCALVVFVQILNARHAVLSFGHTYSMDPPRPRDLRILPTERDRWYEESSILAEARVVFSLRFQQKCIYPHSYFAKECKTPNSWNIILILQRRANAKLLFFTFICKGVQYGLLFLEADS